MYVSYYPFSEVAIKISKAGKRMGRTYESTNPNRIPAQTRIGTVPVVRGTGTDEGWPPHIPKPSRFKGHDFRATSPAISDQTRSTLPDEETGGDNQRRRQSAPGKEGVPLPKVKKKNR